MKKESSFAAKFISALAILGAIAIVIVFVASIGSVLVYFGISIVIVYLLNPFVDWCQKHKIPRTLSILFIFVIFAGVVALVVGLLVPKIADESKLLINNFPKYAEMATDQLDKYDNYVSWAKETSERYGLLDKAAANIQKNGTKIVTKIFDSIFGFFSFLPALIIIPVIVFYLLKDVHELREGFLKALPPHMREDTGLLMDRLNRAIGGFISGQIKLCLIIGVLAWFSMWAVARLPYSLIMGVIAGVTEFIPYIGPILGMVMPLIVALFVGWQKAVLVAIIFLVIQFLENNVLAPRIMSGDVGIHPMIIMFILMAGGQAAGLAGMLIALPVAVILKAFYEHYYINRYVLAPAAAAPVPDTPAAVEEPAPQADDESAQKNAE